jgi:hypothetical protein
MLFERMPKGIEVRCEYSMCLQAFNVWILNRHWSDHNLDALAQPLVFQQMERRVEREPTFHLTEEEAQYMINALWASGLRPTSVGGPGELASVKYHLEDMRKLVFKESK